MKNERDVVAFSETCLQRCSVIIATKLKRACPGRLIGNELDNSKTKMRCEIFYTTSIGSIDHQLD
jgi:hypothetical protein